LIKGKSDRTKKLNETTFSIFVNQYLIQRNCLHAFSIFLNVFFHFVTQVYCVIFNSQIYTYVHVVQLLRVLYSYTYTNFGLSCVDVTENSVKNALQVKDTFIRV
jgi:hypothetical protein